MDIESSSCAATRVRGVQLAGGSSSHQQSGEGTTGLIAGLWGTLPSELLEQLLENSSIRQVQNATNGVNQGACFVVKLRLCIDSAQTGKRCEEISSWSIFDLGTKRWYNVKDELPKGYDYHVTAIDAGLVCTFGNAFTDEQRRASTVHSSVTTQPQILIISNLIGKGIKVLPNPPLGCIDLRGTKLELVVDKDSQTYKIFLIYVGESWNSGDKCLCVYTSSTSQWQISPSPADTGKFGKHVCSAVFKGVLYVLFAAPNGLVKGLYSYNFVEDNWEDTGVKFWKFRKDDGIMVHLCDLVVSDNRLFLMTQCLVDQRKIGANLAFMNEAYQFAEKPNPWPLDISEILFRQKACWTVVQMTEIEVYQNFDVRLNDRKEYEIHACGFDKAILLMSEKVHGETGKYMSYNLVTRLWESLPPNPVESLRFGSDYRGSMWRHGKHMSYLRPPNTLLG